MNNKVVMFVMIAVVLAPAILTAGGQSEPQEEVYGSGSIDIEPLQPDGEYVLPIQASGPNGEPVVGVDAVLDLLSDEDIAEIQGAGYTAAICMAATGNDWAQGQIAGLREVMRQFNVEIIGETDASWSVEKQIADIESVIQAGPDVIFSHPTDGVAVGPTYKRAADAGIRVVFIDSAGAESSFPEDYAGVVQADNYVIARVSAEILAEAIGEEGQVALINYKNRVPHMDMRERAAIETFAGYPNIDVVANQRVGSNEEGASVAESIMIAHPDVEAIWVGWDGPAMTAAAALNNIGQEVYIASPDLGRDAAFSIASRGLFIGAGAQHPYDQGVAAGLIGMAALAGKETPQYVVVPGRKVVRENLAEAWDAIYHAPMPTPIADALGE